RFEHAPDHLVHRPAVVHVYDAAREDDAVDRGRRQVELLDVTEVDLDPVGDAPGFGAVEGDAALLLAEGDAVEVTLGVLGEVEEIAAPAAADVEHTLAGLDGEPIAQEGELALLRRFEIFVVAREHAR